MSDKSENLRKLRIFTMRSWAVMIFIAGPPVFLFHGNYLGILFFLAYFSFAQWVIFFRGTMILKFLVLSPFLSLLAISFRLIQVPAILRELLLYALIIYITAATIVFVFSNSTWRKIKEKEGIETNWY